MTRFATLAEAEKYVRDRWAGPDYAREWPHGWHSDYATFECVGFDLTDIARREVEYDYGLGGEKLFCGFRIIWLEDPLTVEEDDFNPDACGPVYCPPPAVSYGEDETPF